MDTDARMRWRFAIRVHKFRLRRGEACSKCGQWVGHWGGDNERDPCPLIPSDVPLREVRPNCYEVRYRRFSDTLRERAT